MRKLPFLNLMKNKGNIYRGWVYKNKRNAKDGYNNHRSYMDIYDDYADTTDLEHMIRDQMTKFSNFGKKVSETQDYL